MRIQSDRSKLFFLSQGFLVNS